MRKLFIACSVAVLAAGIVSADPVTLVKYKADTKEVTVKDADGKEKTYKLTEKTKYVTTDKDGTKKDADADRATKMLGNEKAAGKAKFEITVADGAITELTFKERKKGN